MVMTTQPVLLGRKIGEIRELRGLSQKELAGRAEISEAYLSLIENGLRNVTDEKLADIARVLKVPAKLIKLMAGEDDPAEDPDRVFQDLIVRTKRLANKLLEQSAKDG